MVKFTDVLSSNGGFFSTKAPSNLTAVFVGATSGIGLGSLRAFAKHTAGTRTTIYVVGRSENALSSLQQSITSINPQATFIPVLAKDLTRLEDAKQAADEIVRHIESGTGKVDLLIMSPGYLSVSREDNGSGVDRLQSIRLYSRFIFLNTLAPLIRKSSHARVVSVLAGGLEGKMFSEDMALNDNYSLPKAAGHGASEQTLYLEEFAKRHGNENIAVVHTYPGLVGGTKLTIKGLPRWVQFLFDHIVMRGIFKLIGLTVEEAGERTIYAATSEKFSRDQGLAEKGTTGEVGSGSYIVDKDSSAIPGNRVLTDLRNDGMGPKVWEFTSQVLARVGLV